MMGRTVKNGSLGLFNAVGPAGERNDDLHRELGHSFGVPQITGSA